MKKIFLLVMVVLTSAIIGFSQNATNTGTVGGTTPVTNPLGISQFEVSGRLLTQNSVSFLSSGDPRITGNFGTTARWNSMGNLTAPSQTLNGFRTQTDGRGLAFGHSIPNSGTVSNPFIEWIGNNGVTPAITPGNLDFRFGLSPTSASPLTMFTMAPNTGFGTFGNSYARNGLLGHYVSGTYGGFGSGDQWIGLGRPYNPTTGSPISTIYGIRTQWNEQALNLALRDNGGTLSDAILEWGNYNVSVNSKLYIRTIINQTPPAAPVKNNDYFDMIEFAPKEYNIKVGTFNNNQIIEPMFAVYDGLNPTPVSSPAPFGTAAIYGITNGQETPFKRVSDYAAAVVGDVYNGRANIENYGILGYGLNSTGDWAGYFVGNVFASSYTTPSDAKLKKQVTSEENILNKLMLLQPKQYYYDTEKFKTLNLQTKLQHGFIAQELETVFPEMITTVNAPSPADPATKKVTDPLNFKAVNYNQLHAVEIAAIQELKKEIDALKEQLQNLPSQTITVLETNNKPSKAMLANSYMLAQNIPNPFTQITTIKYSIPNNTTAIIAVLDLSGKMLLQYPNLSGTAQITINGNTLQAGMYLYSLLVNGQEVVTKKMVLTR